MTKPHLAGVLIATIACLTASAGDDFQLMHSESIGSLKLGMSKVDVLLKFRSKPKNGPVEEWGADGCFHQEIALPEEGIRLMLVSDTKTGRQKLESITAKAPCTLPTKAGIVIGSSEQEVIRAYKRHFNRAESRPGSVFVAGSTYGGVIFQFKAGRVSQIFIGAASE